MQKSAFFVQISVEMCGDLLWTFCIDAQLVGDVRS
jgi:hypothetical protein